MSSYLSPDGTGFGINSYTRATQAGYTANEIASWLFGSDIVIGPQARNAIRSGLTGAQTAADQYETRYNDLNTQYQTALSNNSTLQAQYEEARARAAEYQKQQQQQTESQINQQLKIGRAHV